MKHRFLNLSLTHIKLYINEYQKATHFHLVKYNAFIKLYSYKVAINNKNTVNLVAYILLLQI